MLQEGEIYVSTGEVFVTSCKIKLKTDGIGSCIAVVGYDEKENIGALAHIMFAGSSSHRQIYYNTKYAEDALEVMLYRMKRLGAKQIEVCLVGGGNVLGNLNDTVCSNNIASVKEILSLNKIKIIKEVVGGNVRRGVCLDISCATVYYYEGGSEVKILYKWNKSQS
ncbi:MAG: chemotaxis protein CheD [Candidatus Omnitrophica bacterium]|nr:chemotaxis protein CheD [Candidatus Omnitrophota bacterium]